MVGGPWVTALPGKGFLVKEMLKTPALYKNTMPQVRSRQGEKIQLWATVGNFFVSHHHRCHHALYLELIYSDKGSFRKPIKNVPTCMPWKHPHQKPLTLPLVLNDAMQCIHCPTVQGIPINSWTQLYVQVTKQCSWLYPLLHNRFHALFSIFTWMLCGRYWHFSVMTFSSEKCARSHHKRAN